MNEVRIKWSFPSEKRIEECFFYTTAVSLFVIGMLKWIAVFSTEPLFGQSDPLLHFSNRQIFILFGGLDLALSAFLLVSQNRGLKLVLTMWLTSLLIAHRLAIESASAPYLFSCLGNITGWLPISPRILDRIFFVVYGLPLGGSYFLFVLNWIGLRIKTPLHPKQPMTKATHCEGRA